MRFITFTFLCFFILNSISCVSKSQNAELVLKNDGMPRIFISPSVELPPYLQRNPDLHAYYLYDTVELTLLNHRSLKEAQANREVAKNELARAKGGYGPRLTLAGQLGYSIAETETTRLAGVNSESYGSYILGLTVTQPLWDGLATLNTVRASEADLESVTERVVSNAEAFVLDAVIAHVDVLRRREVVALAQANVNRHVEMLSWQHDRVASGTSSTSDVSQTQSRLARARATLAQSINELNQTESQYERLTGIPAPVCLMPVNMPDYVYANLDSALSEATQYNSQLDAFFSDATADKYARKALNSAFQPQFNVVATADYSDNGAELGKIATPRIDNSVLQAEVALTMNWNLFNSMSDYFALRAQDARITQSREAMYNYYQILVKDVTDTWSNLMSAEEQEELYTDAVIYSTETRDAYIEQFNIGVRSLNDILDVESELFNSSTEKLTAASNVLIGNYRLLALSSQLLDVLDIPEEFYLPLTDKERKVRKEEMFLEAPVREEVVTNTDLPLKN